MTFNKRICSARTRFDKRILLTGGMIVVLGAGLWMWDKYLKERVFPKRWGIVEAGNIYRSGQVHASLIEEAVRTHHIRVIISLTYPDPNDHDQRVEEEVARELGIAYKRFPLNGNGTGDINHYAQAIAAMVRARDANEPVLVHCAAGSQRTGGVIACYRLLIEKRSPVFVFEEMKRYGWNERSDQVLLSFINDHLGELAAQLVALGILERIPDPLPVLPR